MLKQLKIENFTVFTQANFEFSPGLNVIVGENGTGKTHVLKLAYAVIAENYNQGKLKADSENDESILKLRYAEKLINVFKSAALSGLVKYDPHLQGEIKLKPMEWILSGLKVAFSFVESNYDCAFNFFPDMRGNFKNSNLMIDVPPKNWESHLPVFMPTRELLTIYPGFVSVYAARYLEFDETYYDTCLLLGEPLLKKPMEDLLSILEDAMGGKVELDNGRFYLVTPEQGKMEMPMVAEGIRKLAMLAQLIAVGALQKDGYLFWDEPEANLNPRLVRVIARVILQLAKAGIQVFIATHSLFLLRELEVLQAAEKKPVPQRYFALKQTAEGVEVEQGNTVEDLQTLVLLDEELQQSDRYMALEQ